MVKADHTAGPRDRHRIAPHKRMKAGRLTIMRAQSTLTNNELLAFVQLCGRASGYFPALTQCRVGLHFWAAVEIGFEGGRGVDGAPVVSGEW